MTFLYDSLPKVTERGGFCEFASVLCLKYIKNTQKFFAKRFQRASVVQAAALTTAERLHSDEDMSFT